MVDEVEKSEDEKKETKPKKPIFLFLFIFLVLFFLYYQEFAKEHARLVVEHQIAETEFKEKAQECFDEKAKRDAEEAEKARLAAEAAEKERLKKIQLKVLADYYKAINEHDCITAVQLRANYSEKECEKIRSARFNGAKIVMQTPTAAVAYLKIAYRQKGDRTKYHFAGYVQMGKQDGEWVIIGNYSSKVSLDDYVKKYNIAGAR